MPTRYTFLIALAGIWAFAAQAQNAHRPKPSSHLPGWQRVVYAPYKRVDRHSAIAGDLQRLYGTWAGKGPAQRTSIGEMQAAFPQLMFSPGGDAVLVRITAQDVAGLALSLAEASFRQVSVNARRHLVEGYLPFGQLAPGAAGIASLKTQGLMGVLPIYRPISNRAAAHTPVLSQADYLHQTDRVRALGGYDGSGMRIGVMSDSYDRNGTHGAAKDVLEGELPDEGVQVLQDYTTTGTDEGRAMCQLIHDMAPKAGLAFSTVFLGEGNFADQIRNLADPGIGNCTVLTDDVFYFAEPCFQDGIIAQAVDEVVSPGNVAYFSSAGNFATASYQNNAPAFAQRPGSANHQLNFNTGPGGADYRQFYSIPSGYDLSLGIHWSSPFYTTTGVGSDLDAYLLNADGDTVASASDDNLFNQTPFEYLFFINDSSQTHTQDFYLVIVSRAGGTDPSRLRITNLGNAQASNYWTNTGSLFGHTAAAHAQSVAAVPGYEPQSPEYFTSHGYVVILFDADGLPLATPDHRAKPDIAAVDGCENSFFGQDYPVNGTPNFYGTSAAAPDAAAVAALLWQARPGLSSADLTDRLKATAHDIALPGPDSISGAGRVDAYAAIYDGPIKMTPNPQAVDNLDAGSLSRAWTIHFAGPARPRVRTKPNAASGRYSLVMDCNGTAYGSFGLDTAQNEAILHTDLSNPASAGWKLAFRHRMISGETADPLPDTYIGSRRGDGISLSVDSGFSWHLLASLTTNTTYALETINLTQFAAANSLTLGRNVLIKFQQAGLGSADSTGAQSRGGHAFDDIILTDSLRTIPAFTTSSAPTGCPGLQVQYSSAPSITNGISYGYQWSFPGGNPATSTAANPSVTYLAEGSYDVTLTLVPTAGGPSITITDSNYVVIGGGVPHVLATSNSKIVCLGNQIQFHTQTSNCPTTFRWRFPGGTPATSTDTDPIVTYATAGTKFVTVVAINSAGADSSSLYSIQVVPSRAGFAVGGAFRHLVPALGLAGRQSRQRPYLERHRGPAGYGPLRQPDIRRRHQALPRPQLRRYRQAGDGALQPAQRRHPHLCRCLCHGHAARRLYRPPGRPVAHGLPAPGYHPHLLQQRGHTPGHAPDVADEFVPSRAQDWKLDTCCSRPTPRAMSSSASRR